MNKTSLLMPHTCQKAGWCLLILSVLAELVKVLLIHDINVTWYLAKASHVTLIISLFLICLSREQMEDEMIAGFRLQAIGITAYVFFVLLTGLSIVLGIKPGCLNLYLGELLLLVLPILLCVLYYGLFKRMLWQSRKEEAR